jgi:hypothetical protein
MIENCEDDDCLKISNNEFKNIGQKEMQVDSGLNAMTLFAYTSDFQGDHLAKAFSNGSQVKKNERELKNNKRNSSGNSNASSNNKDMFDGITSNFEN